MAVESEADRKKHWEDSGERDEGEQLVTWNNEHLTETNGILWPRP